MLPVLARVPEWVPVLGGQPLTAFGTMLLLAFPVAGWLFVRRLRDHRPGVVGWGLVVTAAVAGLAGAAAVLWHLGLSGVARALVELVRVKQDRLAGPLSVDLLLAVSVVAVGAALWHAREWNRPSTEVA